MSVIRPGNSRKHGLTSTLQQSTHVVRFHIRFKWGYVFVTKLFPHICTYIVICPETAVGIIWGSHWLAHETALVNPLFVTHWHYNTWGLHWSAHETAHVKPLSCHILGLHGVYSGWSMKLRIKSHCFFTHWGLHWPNQETAHVKPLFSLILESHGFHSGQPMKLPV